ncbi:MAG: proton-conducting transporter membrane subunit, partial [Candidatus Eiseniibacteriota bacterium]
MIEALLAVLVAALAAPILVRLNRRAAPWLLAAVPPLAATRILLLQAGSSGETLLAAWTWIPELGLDLAFRLDGLSVLLGLLIGWIGGFVVLHSGTYLAGNPRLGQFYLLLLAFLAAMFGLVLADNLFLLFVCWELTSVTSYFLIGFKHGEAYARDAARRALVTTGAGGLALLGGLVLLVLMGERAGLDAQAATRFSTLLEHGAALRADPLYSATLILILLGCLTKSAQFPFHHWLPAAMAGPTPVSALLHSATMVKAGVFLLARLHPALGGTPLWSGTLILAGTVTMVTGATLAVGQRDLKALLADTTVSALGTLVLLLGIGSAQALAAMVVFLTVHALYKSSLFLAVGNVDRQTSSRDLAHLRGLRRAMPITAAAALLAA